MELATMEFDVAVWRDTLSDGSICYAAICPAVDRAHGQGDTEAEVDVADAMAIYLDHEPGKLKTGQAAQEATSELVAELTAEGVVPWIRQVVPARNQVPA
ncbi:hypothetical protein GBAR_LOCUS4419 [Geodia barretti]|uniref:Uncharacterized protein n=1 Tax=Geodia barretti TaxID=519541 RepID=A0AA35R6S4_GEOBA|nr:hypothetical protein GBAR_LOCUS4419 [Geodia barretti]